MATHGPLENRANRGKGLRQSVFRVQVSRLDAQRLGPTKASGRPHTPGSTSRGRVGRSVVVDP